MKRTSAQATKETGGSGTDARPANTAAQTLVDSVSAESILEGLARANALVMAIDGNRRIVWMKHELAGLLPDAADLIGQPVDDFSHEMPIPDRHAFRARSLGFVDGLRDERAAAAARFELGPPGQSIKVEVRGFEIEASAGHPLRVVIANQLSDDAPIAPLPVQIHSDAKLALILDSTPDGVISVDRLGYVTSANEAASRLLDRTLEMIIDQPISAFTEGIERADDFATRIEAGESIDSEEFEVAWQGRPRAWLSVSARPHAFERSDGSRSVETIVVMRDVTERHEARIALEKKNEELESYVRSVSHDLRSPLASLLGFTRLLRDDYQQDLDATAGRFLSRIEEAGRNMERLLRDMLELSRIGAAQRNLAEVDPRPVLTQLETELKLRLEAKRIVLSLPDDPPTLLCDRTRLYQLFSNLIGNAVTHVTGDGTGRIDVEISVTDGEWQLVVADNGPGIAPADHARIFEMFQTARRSGDAKGGSGLGLAIVKKIVDAHSGRISIDSDLGRGARFIVELPTS